MRYEQLIWLARVRKPKVLVEIGTHRGVRAQELKLYCVQYYGFDLWEEGNDETDAIERNGKGRSTMAEARLALAGIEYELIRGNTRETLPEFVKRGIKVDFAFIDGGHSVETIRSDWENVHLMMNPGGLVVFDDYYTPQVPGFGCNEIVKDLKHSILPRSDTFNDVAISLVKVSA